MAFRRRRHQRAASGLSPVMAIFAAALLIFDVLIFLSICAPPLYHHPSFPKPPGFLRRPSRPSAMLDAVAEGKSNVAKGEMFRVPKGGGSDVSNLWESKQSKYFYGCSNASNEFEEADVVTYPNRYLMIATSGGLNQQRTGITDAVVAARILNATLVVPLLDKNSFWEDTSNFIEVFDVDWFISFLSKDVKIVKELPMKGERLISAPFNMRIPRKCTPKCYEDLVLPVLAKKHVVLLTKFDFRLSNNLDTDLQKLRCRVNYHALRFTDKIQQMGETLIQRMEVMSKSFIALHLRFEPDMLAFSGCYYGGGDKETRELGAIRKRWKNLHTSNPEKERRQGKCPLTPEEMGLMLRALGFGKDVHIYVASGEVYGGEKTLAPLKALFPNFHSKETLASREELAPLMQFSSRMAALDFIVCDGSDVFVANNNGNMARMLAGRRRYFGHKRTIRPNAKKLYSLFQNRSSMTWDAFASKVHKFQKGFVGDPNEVLPGRAEFHENPSTCICEKEGAKSEAASSNTEPSDEVQDWDYGEMLTPGKISTDHDQTYIDYDLFSKFQDPESEGFFSD